MAQQPPVGKRIRISPPKQPNPTVGQPAVPPRPAPGTWPQPGARIQHGTYPWNVAGPVPIAPATPAYIVMHNGAPKAVTVDVLVARTKLRVLQDAHKREEKIGPTKDDHLYYMSLNHWSVVGPLEVT